MEWKKFCSSKDKRTVLCPLWSSVSLPGAESSAEFRNGQKYIFERPARKVASVCASSNAARPRTLLQVQSWRGPAYREWRSFFRLQRGERIVWSDQLCGAHCNLLGHYTVGTRSDH